MHTSQYEERRITNSCLKRKLYKSVGEEIYHQDMHGARDGMLKNDKMSRHHEVSSTSGSDDLELPKRHEELNVSGTAPHRNINISFAVQLT